MRNTVKIRKDSASSTGGKRGPMLSRCPTLWAEMDCQGLEKGPSRAGRVQRGPAWYACKARVGSPSVPLRRVR